MGAASTVALAERGTCVRPTLVRVIRIIRLCISAADRAAVFMRSPADFQTGSKAVLSTSGPRCPRRRICERYSIVLWRLDMGAAYRLIREGMLPSLERPRAAWAEGGDMVRMAYIMRGVRGRHPYRVLACCVPPHGGVTSGRKRAAHAFPPWHHRLRARACTSESHIKREFKKD
jgi:hypothetical protein